MLTMLGESKRLWVLLVFVCMLMTSQHSTASLPLSHSHTPSLAHKHTFKLRERGRELMRKLMGEDKTKLAKRERGKKRERDGGVENN